MMMSPDDPLRSDDDDDLDSLRSLLESSWNSASMGSVPTTPESAAEEASASVSSAVSAGCAGALLVDVRLPAFDITQGPNMYDDVLAAEFCAALADGMRERGVAERSLILVRDAGMASDAARVMEAKERKRREDEEYERARAGIDDDDDDEEEEDEEGGRGGGGAVEFYDDFADFGGSADEAKSGGRSDPSAASSSSGSSSEAQSGGASNSASSSSGSASDDVDSFRKKLISSWDDDEGAGAAAAAEGTTPSEAAEKVTRPAADAADAASAPSPSQPRQCQSQSQTPRSRAYRLSSLFGDDAIADPSSPSMFQSAIESVDRNVVPLPDEDAVIVLSPVDPAEMVAMRRIVQRYGGARRIVLVNSRLDPPPQELSDAEVAYSIRPLVARVAPSSADGPLRGRPDPAEPERATKIVVMRRHPGDWEVFVDADGEGFQLAETLSHAAVENDKVGPDMEWVAGCVKRHMRDKFTGT